MAKGLLFVLIMMFVLFPAIWFTSASQEELGKTRLKNLGMSRFKEVLAGTSVESVLEIAKRIAVVRVPDTKEHAEVQEYIKSSFSENWQIDEDTFTTDTLIGRKTFTNIIATLKTDVHYIEKRNADISSGKSKDKTGKQQPKVIVLAAHYDSKIFPDPNKFVGATDSAVPCALMIDLAKNIESALIKTTGKRPVLKLVFFDGEEAFKDWTETDSLYGSRHLAEQWSTTNLYGNKTIIQSIETFILLDLIGGKSPKFYSFFEDTTWLFDRLKQTATKLKDNTLSTTAEPMFSAQRMFYGNSGVQDDHKPFLDRGVSCLHLIPLPFPNQWHKDDDNMNNVDSVSVKDWAMILRVFMLEYLQS